MYVITKRSQDPIKKNGHKIGVQKDKVSKDKRKEKYI